MGELPATAPSGSHDQLVLSQAAELRLDIPAGQRLDGRHRELAPGHGGNADHLALGLGQRLQSRAEEHLDRSWQPDGGVVVGDQRGQVLGKQRIALRGGDHTIGVVGRQARAGADKEVARFRVVQAFQRERQRVCTGTPPGAAVDELGPGRADHEQRPPPATVGELLDRVEQGILGPVHVLEHDHDQACVCHRTHQPRRRPRQVDGSGAVGVGRRR
jgi:hypothetical protein